MEDLTDFDSVMTLAKRAYISYEESKDAAESFADIMWRSLFKRTVLSREELVKEMAIQSGLTLKKAGIITNLLLKKLPRANRSK
ncbi:hypothetical protein MYX07_05930 [Patescibacteria group bacterium AH-259-L07]|nr:hypothetical protein [Patescibacteria group bacterium AH-259-L07]